MRGERAFFQWETEAMRGLIDVRGERFQGGRGFHARPEDARALFVWEKAQAAEFEIHRLRGTDSGEHILERGQFSGIGFAEEFQGDVEVFRADPLRLGSNGAE